MNFIAKFVVENARLAWGIALAVIAMLAIGAGAINRDIREQQRLSLLETEAERRAIDVMSQTLNGNLMGSVAMLGLIDQDIKREAKGMGKPNASKVVATLESIGRTYDADGVFIVAEDGVIASSWDNAGKPSTGLNVKFRPYYQMAMQGSTNVYAAVSLARGDRSLYFSVPVFIDTTNATEAIGAVVARTGLAHVDDVLRNKADIAMLLSPQGVVFASTRKEWIGFLSGKPTPERLKAIRQLKQFGNMFEKKEPSLLPVTATSGRHVFEGRHYAVATAPVKWNDVSGDWQLVLMEDLDRSVSSAERYWVSGMTFTLLLGISMLILFTLRGQYAQTLAASQLQQFAAEQEQSAAYKARLAAASIKFQQVADVQFLGQTFLTEVHAIFGALQAVFYAFEHQGAERMQLLASFACSEAPAADLAPGEGMLGQCATERRVIVLDLPDDERLKIRSGLGDMRPASVVMAPVMLNEKLLGVVEFALPTSLSTAEQASLEELVDLLAMNIEIVSRSSHTQEMLSATRAAQETNAEQLAFQQALVDTIPYPVFYKGADTRFLGFNTAYETTFNVRREDVVGKRVLDLEYLPEADRLAYQAEDEAVIAGATTVDREMRIPFADGKTHDTLYYVSGFRRADGSPGGLVGTFIDISEMKRAQQDLTRLSDAERFNRIAQGREARIVELKQEINALCQRLSESPRYAAASLDAGDDEQGGMSDLPVGENLKLVHLNWHSAYACGQAEIDQEHHTLFAIANDLLNAIVAGKSPDAIDTIINQLVQETTQHFADEEAILQAHGYEQLEEHAAIHRALIEKAVHLIGEFKAGKVEAGPFFQFLAYDVIARHMLGEDRKFFSLFQSDGARGDASSLSAIATIPSLAELVDLDELQTLFSAFCDSIGIAAAIIDLDAKVLASSRWQRACTDFHRVNPDSCARCIESDTELSLKLQDGQDYTMYKCKNGMTDCASPIIVEGHHLANVFIGQFHLGPPDMAFFAEQARQFGYPEAEYLQAISDVPVMDEKRLPVILQFLSGFARMVSTMSLARHRADAAQQRLQQQAEQLHRERIAALSLAEDAEHTRSALAAISKESQA